MNTTTAPKISVPSVRRSREFTLTEYVIAKHINQLDNADALRFTDAATALHYTPFVCKDGEYVQADYVPQCYDVEDFNQQIAPLVAHALNEYCQVHDVTDGLLAVNPDNATELLLYRY